jgi:hypothetical protein
MIWDEVGFSQYTLPAVQLGATDICEAVPVETG